MSPADGDGVAGAGERLHEAGHDMRTMPPGDPDLWIAIAARAGATDEEIAAGPVPAGHIREALRVRGFDRWARAPAGKRRCRTPGALPLPGDLDRHGPQ